MASRLMEGYAGGRARFSARSSGHGIGRREFQAPGGLFTPPRASLLFALNRKGSRFLRFHGHAPDNCLDCER
jgi:hypothetical protein